MRQAWDDFQLATGMCLVVALTCLPGAARPPDTDVVAVTAVLVVVTSFRQELGSRLLMAATSWLMLTGSVQHRHAHLIGLGRADALRALLVLSLSLVGTVRGRGGAARRPRYRRLPFQLVD